MNLRAHLQSFTRNSCGLFPEAFIVIGVSGGADSVCLLDALHELGFRLVVAHFNHRLRKTAEEDARFVEQRAARLGVVYVGGEGDVRGYAQTQGLSLEEAARTLRYRFLFEQARRFQAQAVAVAHHADDQVETVLMHFLRGAGLDGLKGMQPRTILPVWDANIPLVRPLLEVSKAEILAYGQEHQLHPRYDETNEDTTYFRNRLRHELIPLLETINPRFREVITRTAKALAADQEILHALTGQAWEACLLRLGPSYLCLSTAAFLQHAPGIQRRLLRRGIETLRPGLRDVDFAALERAVNFLMEKRAGVCELTGNLRMFAEGERFWLAEKETELPADEWPQMDDAPVQLDVGGEIALRAGWRLRAERVTPRGPVPEGPDRVWIDARGLSLPFIVRRRRPGDVFQPLGMEKPVKLADFLINAKIPRRARDFWPLVCVGDEIVWIPGVRLGERFRLGEGAETVIELSVEGSSYAF